MPYTSLLGGITTGDWTAAAQRKVDGDATKFCMSTNGTNHFAKKCTATEVCNPHAAAAADVCKTKTAVLAHGEIAVKAATTDAVDKVECIGLTFSATCVADANAATDKTTKSLSSRRYGRSRRSKVLHGNRRSQ